MPRTGRPVTLRQSIEVPDLDPDKPPRRIKVGDYIVERMEANGLRAELQARAAGVHQHTIDAWLAEGARAQEKTAQGKLLTVKERDYSDFLAATRLAHARWVQRNLELHDSVARGGLIIGKVVEKVDPRQKDPLTGGPLVLERKVDQARTLPDAKALQWQLEHLARDEGFAPRLEVTGADGGPVSVTSTEEKARAISAELDAFIAGSDARAARDAERVNGSAPAVEGREG